MISLTLIDPSNVHALGEWYNLAMTCDGSQPKAYVNGEPEFSGPLSVIPIITGQTSLGMRANKINFFEGVIAKVRFTPSLVDPDDVLVSCVPGDFERNGLVEAAGYDLWKADFGNAVAQAGDGCDGNRDGVVDAADYTVWRDAQSAGAGAGAIGESVPESTAI